MKFNTHISIVCARILSRILFSIAPAVLVAPLAASTVYTTQTVVTTWVGTAGVTGTSDGSGTTAKFNHPFGAAVDSSGNVYVADYANHAIRKITPDGVVSTFAGSPGNFGTSDGTGAGAHFNYPTGVAVDSYGNVYVCDQSNHTIRKITSGGVVSTFAGLAGNSGSADGTGTAARFNQPSGLAIDGSGNLYVADTNNYTIRKVTSAGVVTTYAGTAGAFGSTDGTGAAARFNSPNGVAIDGFGNVYVADQVNQTIRKITSGRVVTTIAGTAGSFGTTDGTGSAARFYGPAGIAVDGAGTIYVGDSSNNTVRKISNGGVVTTLAGSSAASGTLDGSSSFARFNGPNGLALDSNGVLYVVDQYGDTVRKIVQDVGTSDFNGDGKADLLWENTSTGDRGAWLMNGTNYTWAYLGRVPVEWNIVGAGDFDGDGQTDIVYQNTSTGDCGIWLMNGTNYAGWSYLGRVATDWKIVAVADFNGDGQPDIVWENTTTGDRGIWIMNGTTYGSWVYLGRVPLDWHIAAAADLNGDGKPDIVWENTTSGDRGIWIMNGSTYSTWVYLDRVPLDWTIRSMGDFNADGKVDLLWENTTSGDHGVWLMNGTAYAGWLYLQRVPTEWRVCK